MYTLRTWIAIVVFIIVIAIALYYMVLSVPCVEAIDLSNLPLGIYSPNAAADGITPAVLHTKAAPGVFVGKNTSILCYTDSSYYYGLIIKTTNYSTYALGSDPTAWADGIICFNPMGNTVVDPQLLKSMGVFAGLVPGTNVENTKGMGPSSAGTNTGSTVVGPASVTVTGMIYPKATIVWGSVATKNTAPSS